MNAAGIVPDFGQLILGHIHSSSDAHRVCVTECEMRGVVLVEDRLVPNEVLFGDEARLRYQGDLPQMACSIIGIENPVQVLLAFLSMSFDYGSILELELKPLNDPTPILKRGIGLTIKAIGFLFKLPGMIDQWRYERSLREHDDSNMDGRRSS